MSCSLFNQTGQKVNLKMDIRQIDLKYIKKNNIQARQYPYLINCRKEAMGDLSSPSEVIIKLLTIIFHNNFFHAQYFRWSKTAEVFNWRIENNRFNSLPGLHDKKQGHDESEALIQVVRS